MALIHRLRSATTGQRSVYGRLAFFKNRANRDHARLDSLEQLLAEVDQRTLALTHQMDRLQEMIETLDPQGTRDMAVGVRDSVRELSVQLTDQANQTSRILADLSSEHSS